MYAEFRGKLVLVMLAKRWFGRGYTAQPSTQAPPLTASYIMYGKSWPASVGDTVVGKYRGDPNITN